MTDVRRALAIAILALLTAAPAASAQSEPQPFTTGFIDFEYFSPNIQTRATWLDRTLQAGAAVVRLSPEWVNIAPINRPRRWDPTDPADPNYRWGPLDDAVRDSTLRLLEPLVAINSAPAWAETGRRPLGERPGTWKPKPKDLADFTTAAARRYSGTYPDPTRPGQTLPRVRYWQMWNEPNLSTYLTPQWIKRHGRFQTYAPGHYRKMLNAGYDALKAVNPENVVVSAGTAPFGDLESGGRRIPPARFVRDLLCLDRRLRALRCANPAKLDVLAHHPYSVGGPRRHARNRDDVLIPDFAKLSRPLRAAERAGRVLPAGRKRLWVTELSWDSSPPDPQGVPESRRARWIPEAFYVLWRQGVDTAIWFRLRDEAKGRSYGETYQSGLYLVNGAVKPTSAAAFRFPFYAERRGKGIVRFFGKSPVKGQVELQRRVGDGFQTVATVDASGASRVFEGNLTLPEAAEVRALSGGEASMSWTIQAAR